MQLVQKPSQALKLQYIQFVQNTRNSDLKLLHDKQANWHYFCKSQIKKALEISMHDCSLKTHHYLSNKNADSKASDKPKLCSELCVKVGQSHALAAKARLSWNDRKKLFPKVSTFVT